MGTTWNPADLTNMTLSGGNLTATPTAAGVGGVRGTTAKTSGKIQIQYTNVTFIGAFDMVGIGDLAMSLTGETSVGNEFMYGNSNAIYCNGNTFGGMAAVPANATLDFCFDFGAKLGWGRVNGGSWNGSGTANPATGTGGLTFTGTSLLPFVELTGTTAHATLNTTPSGLVSGFSVWDTVPVPPYNQGRIIT